MVGDLEGCEVVLYVLVGKYGPGISKNVPATIQLKLPDLFTQLRIPFVLKARDDRVMSSQCSTRTAKKQIRMKSRQKSRVRARGIESRLLRA